MDELDDMINDYIMNGRTDLSIIHTASKKISMEYKTLVKKLGDSEKAKDFVMRIINEVDVSVIMEDESHEAVPSMQKFEQLWID